MSEIDIKYSSLGGAQGFLGSSVTGELVCPDGIGHYRHYQHGSIYWSPLTGAHEIHGLIRAKWATLGYEKSFLGYPKTDESSCPVLGGKYNLFQGGTILWFPDSEEAFEVHGAIRSKWGQLGWESGFLGFPVTDECTTPDGIGRYNHFQNGSVYWKPSISAHEVHGLIRGYWASKGWERNSELGYPISDEIPTSEGSKNRYNDFENGVVFWKHGNETAVPLTKLTINNASRTAGEVVTEINKIIIPALTSNSSVYIKSGPYLAEVADYSYDGSVVHNRRYKIHTNIGIDVSAMPDPTSSIDLWIEISYDRSDKKVKAYLTNWSVHTHVPWPTSMGVSASSINSKFRSALDPMLWKPNVVGSIPAGINILSVKVVPNGDLNVYIEPSCFITTACTEAKGLPDDCEELETLRKFRNEYLAKLPEGNEILNEYSWIAPQIVHKINTLDNSKSIYEDLFERLVRNSVALIQEGKMEEAYKNYMSIVTELKDKYVVE